MSGVLPTVAVTSRKMRDAGIVGPPQSVRSSAVTRILSGRATAQSIREPVRSGVIAGVGSTGALWQYCHWVESADGSEWQWQYCHNAPQDPTPAIRISETLHHHCVREGKWSLGYEGGWRVSPPA